MSSTYGGSDSPTGKTRHQPGRPPRSSKRFDRAELLQAAAQDDAGFDLAVFVQMLRSHRRLRDGDFPHTDVPIEDLRAYFDNWANDLDR